MKILALTKYFPPEIGTASHLIFELVSFVPANAINNSDLTMPHTIIFYNRK
jgi:hypothetical protein